jgi:putative transposase
VEATPEAFLPVTRYVERNALRANLVARAEEWRWCSLWRRASDRADLPLAAWPVERPADWQDLVNAPQTDGELAALRRSLVRGRPYGSADWTMRTAGLLGLTHTLRPRGRPRRRNPGDDAAAGADAPRTGAALEPELLRGS